MLESVLPVNFSQSTSGLTSVREGLGFRSQSFLQQVDSLSKNIKVYQSNFDGSGGTKDS